MSRFFKLLSLAILCAALASPQADARGRNNGGGGGNASSAQRQSTPSRSSNSSARPANTGGSRSGSTSGISGSMRKDNYGGTHNATPVNNQQRPSSVNPGQNNRPSNGGGNMGNGNGQNNRPGNGGGNMGNGNGQNNRPGNGGGNMGNGGNNRPGSGSHGGDNWSSGRPGNGGGNNGHGHNQNEGPRPGTPGPGGPGHSGPAHGGPGYGPGPGHGPGPGPNHFGNVPPRAPYRPYMPAGRPYRPPMPPAHFHPTHGCPVIGTILGVAIGTAINISLNHLITNGYAVAGYTNDAVYLNNVNQLNLLWPNATLYYNSMGGLIGSEFVYSTPYYDMNRYNTAYRYLMSTYGAPVSSMQLAGGGIQVSWFGFDGQYVSLQYLPGNAFDGSFRYYTTLSFGR